MAALFAFVSRVAGTKTLWPVLAGCLSTVGAWRHGELTGFQAAIAGAFALAFLFLRDADAKLHAIVDARLPPAQAKAVDDLIDELLGKGLDTSVQKGLLTKEQAGQLAQEIKAASAPPGAGT